MKLETHSQGEVMTIEVGGDASGPTVDLSGQRLGLLRTEISNAIGYGTPNVVLNLERVRFIDSEGIGALVLYKKLSTDAGGDLKLLKPRGRIAEILHAVRLDEVFDVHEDESTAVAAFGTDR